jgi:hypothetical protein
MREEEETGEHLGFWTASCPRAPGDDGAKRRVKPLSKTCRDVPSQRPAWFDGQIDLQPERLVSIDET